MNYPKLLKAFLKSLFGVGLAVFVFAALFVIAWIMSTFHILGLIVLIVLLIAFMTWVNY